MSGANLRISLNNSNALRLNLVGGTTQQIRMVSPASGSFSGKISIDTSEAWSLNPTYVPKKGEIVIYSDRNVIDGINYPGMKIGDGNAFLVDIPFFEDDVVNSIIEIINDHINNQNIHVSQEDRNFWNSKLNCDIDRENLIFTRN